MSVSRGVKSTPKALQVMLLVLSVILFLLVCAWAVLGFVVPAFRPPKVGLATATAPVTQTVAPAETALAPTLTEALPTQPPAAEITPGVVVPSATPRVLATPTVPEVPTGVAPGVSPAAPVISATPTTPATVRPTTQPPPTEELAARVATVTAERAPGTAPAGPVGSPTPTGSPTPSRGVAPATPTQSLTETPEMAGAISETTILVTATLLPQSPTAAATARTAEPSATATVTATATQALRPTIPPATAPSARPSESPAPAVTVGPTRSPTPTPPLLPTETPTPVLAVTPALPTTVPAPTLPAQPAPPGVQPGNLVINGDFEQGLQSTGVAVGWQSFNNAGAEFSFQPRDWEVLTLDGQHSQFMRIRKAQQPDRYLGIYQTVFVVPGATYTFSIEGAVRSEVGDVNLSQYGYRLQVGFDLQGAQAWKAVDNWIELPWDEQPRQPQSLRIDRFSTQVTPVGDKLTIFIRAWKKWADEGEGAYNVDNIRLEGPAPGTVPQPQPRAQGTQPEVAPAGGPAAEAERPAQAWLSAGVSAPEASQLVAPAEIEAQALGAAPKLPAAPSGQSESVAVVPAQPGVQAPARPQLEARPVPVTGAAPASMWHPARVWITMALLLILIASASWRMLWTRI